MLVVRKLDAKRIDPLIEVLLCARWIVAAVTEL